MLQSGAGAAHLYLATITEPGRPGFARRERASSSRQWRRTKITSDGPPTAFGLIVVDNRSVGYRTLRTSGSSTVGVGFKHMRNTVGLGKRDCSVISCSGSYPWLCVVVRELLTRQRLVDFPYSGVMENRDDAFLLLHYNASSEKFAANTPPNRQIREAHRCCRVLNWLDLYWVSPWQSKSPIVSWSQVLLTRSEQTSSVSRTYIHSKEFPIISGANTHELGGRLAHVPAVHAPTVVYLMSFTANKPLPRTSA